MQTKTYWIIQRTPATLATITQIQTSPSRYTSPPPQQRIGMFLINRGNTPTYKSCIRMERDQGGWRKSSSVLVIEGMQQLCCHSRTRECSSCIVIQALLPGKRCVEADLRAHTADKAVHRGKVHILSLVLVRDWDQFAALL